MMGKVRRKNKDLKKRARGPILGRSYQGSKG
jgi:hypothetical protein